MSGAGVLMGEMTWMEYRARLQKPGQIVLLPVGALEQHGPHLPLHTDVVIPSELCRRVAQLIGGIVAPPIAYGCRSQPKSGGGNHFPGTTSLDATSFMATLRDILREFARHGARRVAVMDGHMENEAFLAEAIDLALRDLAAHGVTDMTIVKFGYWEFITPATERALFPDGLASWALEHAAVMETSVLLYLRPEQVRAELIPDHASAAFPPYDIYPTDLRPIPPDGALSSAAGATAEKGRVFVAQVVPDIAAMLTRAFDRPHQEPL
jgi:creatinine amidohydrolase